MNQPIQIFSEIAPLKRVLLHRPGAELDLMPDYLDRLLFDDIPFLTQAQKEHDFFADTLRSKGVEVLYLEDLAAETLTTTGAKEAFLEDYLNETTILDEEIRNEVRNFSFRSKIIAPLSIIRWRA